MVTIKRDKILVYYLGAAIFLFLTQDACASKNFYHGKKLKEEIFQWKQKSTPHFLVMYRDRYFDPEQVLESVSLKFGIQPLIAGIKIRLFIDDGRAYTIVGTKTIYAGNALALAHELAHVLFLQLNRDAPVSIREGIAVYAEYQQEPNLPRVGLKEIIALERDFRRLSKGKSGQDIYARRSQNKAYSQLYAKGLCFVAAIIRDKGIETFKKFYQECSGPEDIEKAWNKIYH